MQAFILLTEIKSGENMFDNVRADVGRYTSGITGIAKIKALVLLFFTQEFLALLVYRFGKCVQQVKIPLLSFLLRIIYFFLNKIIAEICAGIRLDLNSEIGKGFMLGHFGGIVITGNIGENCTVAQQVVIGYKGGFSGGGVPTLGNNVYVGAGAKILGDVKIGNNVKIGANAVVVKDIPDGATAVGVPAVVVRRQ